MCAVYFFTQSYPTQVLYILLKQLKLYNIIKIYINIVMLHWPFRTQVLRVLWEKNEFKLMNHYYIDI
mgnify:CR=1 FL=1